MIDNLLTPAAVAARFGVHPATVARWLRDGILRGEKPGHDWVIPESALAGFEPPARGPRPAAARSRLLDQAKIFVANNPALLIPTDYDLFLQVAHELARQSGNTRERCRQTLAKAIRLARGEMRR